jgi:thiol-disulfide isomerase/thioredoxin
MKLTSLLHIIFLSSFEFSVAQSVIFEPSLRAAFNKAEHENKLVFVEYYNAECPVCKKLEPVFQDHELGRFYNEHFINYKLNTENIKKEDSIFILKRGLKFESVPYFLFFDNAQNLVHYSGTKQDIRYLVEAGKTALDPEERTANLINKYNSGDRTIKALYAYSNLLQLYKNDSLRMIIAGELFNAFPKEDLGSEKSYIITKNCVNSIENGFFKYWISHIDELKEFEKKAKGGHEINVLEDILLKSINSDERKGWGLTKIQSVKEMILKTELSKDPDSFFWEQESMLLVKENRTGKAADLFLQTIANDSSNITAAAYVINYYLTIFKDSTDLRIVKPWIDRLNKKNISKAEAADLIYCNILFYKRMKDKKMVTQLGRQAVRFYKDNKIDSARLNLLLTDP